MKSNFIYAVSFSIGLSITAIAQNSVQITSKKLSYKKIDPNQFSSTFEIQHPEVTSQDAPLEEIRKSISYWTNYETTLEEIQNDVFTHELFYRVNYNGKGILNITLVHSGSTAYPSEFEKNVVIDLESGESIKLKDAFENRTGLYNMIAKAHQTEVDDASAGNKEVERFLKNALQYFSIYEIEDFTVSDKGVTFLFDYEFAHVIRAAQPEGKYFFTWKELAPFVSDVGPLRYFIEETAQ